MAEYASLHATSLLLVGKNVKKPTSAGPTRQSTIVDTNVPSDVRKIDTLPYKKNEQPTKEGASETGIETIMQTSSQRRRQNSVLVLPTVDDLVPDESRWRAHGKAHRQKLLEDDDRNGGRDFTMSFDCSVQRYFSVAHWALEQFHQLYQTNTEELKELEDLYLMGSRIVSFLTDCLPRHPGLGKAPYVRQRSKQELDLLQKCLEDVALRIDEQVCNQCVEDDDLFLDSMLAAQMDDIDDDDEDSENELKPTATPKKRAVSTIKKNSKMVHFGDLNFPDDEFQPISESTPVALKRQEERRSAESPTGETVGTTGTDSLDPNESNYQNIESPDTRKEGVELPPKQKSVHKAEDHFDVDDIPDDELSLISENVSVWKGVRLDFLRTIACEPVLYETDSEAADSWANNTVEEPKLRSRPCLPSSSGMTPTYDPARIAFRDLMNRISQKSILKRSSKLTDRLETIKSEDRSASVSPTFSDIMEERDTVKGETGGIDHSNFDEIIEREIKEYLDSSQTEEDPQQFVESCHEKITSQTKPTNHRSERQPNRRRRDGSSSAASYISSSSSSSGSNSSSSSSLKSLKNRHGSQTSAFSSFQRKKSSELQPQKAVGCEDFFTQDDWISFDNSTGNSYFADVSF